MDVWGEGVEGPDVFKIFVLSSKFLSQNFLQVILFYIFCLLYILLVRRNFDSSESILSGFVESGHGKHVADDFIIT